jgi:GTP cyclohydrolase I
LSEILKWRSPEEAAQKRPSREAAMEAVRTLIAWAGDDPEREGLKDTPKRVVDAYREWFRGSDDIVMLKKIDVESHCEHHIAPFLGKAYVAYMPSDAVVGISKIARVVEIFAKRLQTQETMTIQIAEAIEQTLKPRGVAVLIDAEHQCMSTRGVHHKDVTTVTTQFTGAFKDDTELRNRFLKLAGYG